jgi:hypothetical protein
MGTSLAAGEVTFEINGDNPNAHAMPIRAITKA